MNADAYRYRPLASALRAQRARLNPQWEGAAATEARAQARLRSAANEFRAWNASSGDWKSYIPPLFASVPSVGLAWPSGKRGGKQPPSLPGAFTDYFDRHGYYPDTSTTRWRKRGRDGTYDVGEDVLPSPAASGGGAAPGRGASGPRPPKRWVNPDQPWPHATAANGDGSGSGRARRGGKIRGSVRIERY